MLVFLFGLRRVAQGAFKCGRIGGRMARHNDMHSLGFYRGSHLPSLCYNSQIIRDLYVECKESFTIV
jgi:hypothetical protein